MPTWSYWTETSALRDDPGIQQRALEADPVLDNMGGILMFPGWQIEGHLTLNQARGFSQKARIGDRVDLTLECILRGYRGDFDWEDNPLGPTIERYWQFFELFGDFRGYVAFWMLEDLLTVDGQRVNFLMEADVPGGWDFASRSPLPIGRCVRRVSGGTRVLSCFGATSVCRRPGRMGPTTDPAATSRVGRWALIAAWLRSLSRGGRSVALRLVDPGRGCSSPPPAGPPGRRQG